MKSTHAYGFFAIISVLALLSLSVNIFSSPTPFTGGVETTGRVVDILPNGGSSMGLGTETWTVSFETADKQNVIFYDFWNQLWSGTRGESVLVYYDPGNPKKAMTIDSFAVRIISFTILLVCSIYLSYKWNKERGRKPQVASFGEVG